MLFAEHLKLIPDSRIRALSLGGMQYLGWDTAMYSRANLHDLIHALALGLGGKKLQAKDTYPRPTVESEQAVTTTIADFDVAAFLARIAQ